MFCLCFDDVAGSEDNSRGNGDGHAYGPLSGVPVERVPMIMGINSTSW